MTKRPSSHSHDGYKKICGSRSNRKRHEDRQRQHTEGCISAQDSTTKLGELESLKIDPIPHLPDGDNMKPGCGFNYDTTTPPAARTPATGTPPATRTPPATCTPPVTRTPFATRTPTATHGLDVPQLSSDSTIVRPHADTFSCGPFSPNSKRSPHLASSHFEGGPPRTTPSPSQCPAALGTTMQTANMGNSSDPAHAYTAIDSPDFTLMKWLYSATDDSPFPLGERRLLYDSLAATYQFGGLSSCGSDSRSL